MMYICSLHSKFTQYACVSEIKSKLVKRFSFCFPLVYHHLRFIRQAPFPDLHRHLLPAIYLIALVAKRFLVSSSDVHFLPYGQIQSNSDWIFGGVFLSLYFESILFGIIELSVLGNRGVFTGGGGRTRPDPPPESRKKLTNFVSLNFQDVLLFFSCVR